MTDHGPETPPLIDGAAPPLQTETDPVRRRAKHAGWVTSTALARMEGFRCTPQSIANWAGAGMPVAATDALGTRWFDPAACLAWRRVHRPEGLGRGGRRAGAGRKPGVGRKAKGERREAGGERGGGAELPLVAAAKADGESGGRGEGESKARAPDGGGDVAGLSAKELADHRLKTAQAEKIELENRVRLGKLLDAAAVYRAQIEALAGVRTVLEGMPRPASDRIVGELSLDPHAAPVVERVLTDAVGRIMDLLATLEPAAPEGVQP